jgi:glutathione synthase/RimK-type ligase-like ATP-grasp enzyme
MSEPKTIGVLVPTNGTSPQASPNERPIGRAALLLATEGIDVIFGDTLRQGCIDGYRATPSGWQAVQRVAVDAIHDRYPSQIRSDHFRGIQTETNGVPMGNPLEFTMLCRDKIESQRRLEALGVPMPSVCEEPSEFSDRIHQWTTGFLKPRYGALGIGVRCVTASEPMPSELPGVVPGRADPAILQQAIRPPSGWASRTVRVLLQRTVSGGWFQGTPVVRQSRNNPVANAAQGAEVVSGHGTLSTDCLEAIHSTVGQIAEAFDRLPEAALMVEAGVDLVLDSEMQPWLIEVNSRPRGRMEILASTDPRSYQAAHVEACARPIRVLAHRKTKG